MTPPFALPADSDPKTIAEERRRLGEVAARTSIPPVAAGLSLLYLGFAVLHLLLLPPELGRIMVPLALGSSLVLGGIWRWAGRIPSRWSHEVVLGVATVALVNSLVHLWLDGDPIQTTNVALVVLGSGALFVNNRHGLILFSAAALGWLAVAAADGFAQPQWLHFGLGLLSAIVLGILILQVRTRAVRRLAVLEVGLATGEARYQHLFDASPAMIWSHDLDGTVLAVNRACSEVTGVPLEALVGCDMKDFLLNGGDAYQEYLAELIQNGTTSGVAFVVGQGGRTLQWLYEGTLISDPLQGRHVVTTARDVTELEEAREKLQRSKQDLEDQVAARTAELSAAAERLQNELAERRSMEARLLEQHKLEGLGRLAGGVAHEFNNILAIIQGNAELAASEVDPEGPGRAYLNDIEVASQRGGALVTKVLDFSESPTSAHAPFDLEPVLRETIALLRGAMPRDIDLEISVSESLGQVMGNPVQIRQVLVNLVANARQALGGTGGWIRVRAARLEDSPAVQVEVLDNGVGIPPDDLPRVFDPFFTTREVGEGHGLGLSVVHGIVRGHGGEIAAECPEEGGTRVVFTLPVSLQAAVTGGASAGQPAMRPSGTKVLVVEDEPAILSFTCRALERRGYVAIPAPEGSEALTVVREQGEQLGLLITDMSMPGMKGDALIRQVRVLLPGLPSLIMTGFSAGVEVGTLEAGGPTGVIGKPFRTQELFDAVEGLLAVRS